LFFDWKVDMVQTLQLVNAAMASVQSQLPGTATITTNRLTFASFPIIGYSLTSDSVPQTQLWEMATYDLKPRLNRLDGVATVIVQGGQEPEFHIVPDPAKLVESAITVQDILDAVGRTNLVASPGLIPQGHELFLTLVSGQVKDPAQIGQIVIKTTQAGIPVRIGDVAAVTPAVKPVYTIVTANGKPAVLLNINRQPNSNTVTVANEVHDEIAAIQKTLPHGVKLEPFYDQSGIVNASIKSVRDAILIGLVLASIIMVVFLRDWGASIVAGLVIPITIVLTFIFLKLLGQSFNLMTLGGVAAAVGLVIDDAIVVVENIALHRDSGQSRAEAIRSALREISVPLVGSTLTPIVVFLPLITLTGVTGIFFKALAITVSIALLTSLLLALIWTPTLALHFMKDTGDPELREKEEKTASRFHRVVEFHERWLHKALERPRYLAIAAVTLAVISLVTYQFLGSDLLPSMDEGGFILDYIMPAGSSLAETDRVIRHIEAILRATPEVESTSRRTGMQLGLAAVTEANTGDIAVKLKDYRSRGIDEVIAEVREKIKQQEPAVDVDFTQVLQDMIGDLSGGSPDPIQVKLFANDPQLLDETAPKVGDNLEKIHGVVDVLNGVDNTISGPAVMFQVDPSVTALAGFTPQEVATDASAMLEGEPATTPVVANDRAYTVRVRFPDRNRGSVDAMRNTVLASSSGHTASLGTLAQLSELPGQTEILRENLQRYVAVTARLEGLALSSGISKIQRVVAGMHLPKSIRVIYGGQYEEQQKQFKDLILVLVLAIVLVFAVLLFEFGSFAAPAAILAAALLSTSGVFLALLVTRTSFSVSAFMGLIMVVGIVAKNGILLLDAEQKYRTSGMSAQDAMLEASRRRLRPIVMTAMATIAGMLPLAFALGAGSEMLQPLAIAVIGGLLISMALSLVLTPVLHLHLVEARWARRG
jgi:CzcA family heavy metal efflux pump